MSQTVQPVNQVVAPQQRDFVNRRVLRRNPVQQPRAVPTAQDAKTLYDAAAVKAQPAIDAADRVLAAVPLAQAVAAAQQPYVAASRQLAADLKTANYTEALTDLPAKLTEANAVLTAKAKADAAVLKQKQLDGQLAAYDAMAPVLGEVKRTYLPDGAAKRIGKEDLAAGKHFKAYLAALQALEDAKRGVNPAQPTPPKLAQDVKAKCDGVVATAQAYLDHYATELSSSQQKNKDSLSKKRYCEESLISARQYGMAMELDAAGKPTPGQPWDRKTETRVAGLRAAMSFETGYQKATGLKGEGAAGASDSYWIKSAAPKDGRDDAGKPTVTMVANKRGEAIFKPADGEEAPAGSSDRKGAGAAKEALASANAKLFGAQTGIDLGVPETNVVSIGAYAVAGAKPGSPPLIGSAQQHAGVSKQINDIPRAALKQVKAAEAHKMALMDIMSLSVDRHGGNIMVDDADPTNPKLIPIDHGGTLPSRADFPDVKKRMAGVKYTAIGARPDAEIVNTLLMIPASYENFDPEMQAKIELLRPDEMEQGMKDQRAALDGVHPDLGAGGKVGDDSFHLSKRAMMFLKKAAKTLSPAEIQIALGAHGEQLFDASDANFDTVADQVIAEAAPKKPAYLEFMTTPKDQQAIILKWLDDNDWTLVDETGKNSPEAFLMRDPVNALKLFKAGTKNNNPIKVTTIRDPVPDAGDPNAQPDAKTKDAILQAFPALSKDTDDNRWNRRLAAWNAIKSMGGMAAYKAACDATGGEAASIADVPKLLDLWTEINKRQNAAALAQLKPAPGQAPLETLKRTLAWVANQQVAAQQLNQASTAAAAVDDAAALAASATRLLTAIRNVIGGIEDQAQAATFGQQANAAAAKLAQGDNAGAEADARALNVEVNEFALQEVKDLAIALADGLATLQVSDNDREAIAEVRANAKDATSLDVAKLMLAEARKLDQQIRADGTQPKPVIAVQPAANAPQGAPRRPAANPPGALPKFSWDPAAASAVKKQAVKAKIIKDTKTGLTEALAVVNKVRDRIDLIQDNWQPSTKIPMLEAVLNAYAEFSRFVSSKLRGVSKHADWAAYCNSAADLTEAAIKATKARLDGVKNGTAV